MKEIMEWTVSIWNSYWGDGYVQYLLLIAVICLLIWKRKENSIRQILPYVFTVLLLFLCPLSARVIQKCIGQDVYWRVLWLLPATLVIALACAEFLHIRMSRPIRFITVLLLTGLTVFCGKTLLDSGQYVKVHNYQKVPDEVAHICNMIREDAGESEVCLATDENISPYIRVYDPSITMPYGRRGKGAITKNTLALYRAVHPEGRVKYKQIARLASASGCNYLAIVLNDRFKQSYVEQFGYQQIGTVNNYGIFRLTETES